VRAVSLHADVVVVTSRVWQTTSTALRGGDEALLVDSPVYPDELEMLPALLEQAGFAVRGLLATHADWDHLLGRAAFPQAPLGCAQTTAARLAAEPGAAQRGLRDFDARHYVQRPRPLSLPAAQALPVPGVCEVGDREVELIPADGHTADGMAIWAPWAGVLVCGDYLSAVEIPTIAPGGSLAGYRATLARLRGHAARAEAVVPGHGPVLGAERALAILDEDLAYLEALAADGEGARLPAGRGDAHQRRLHAENATRTGLTATGSDP
jgi:glyoxylase-like metal-dependent hydrolase (beta-lactamase superfamily II)